MRLKIKGVFIILLVSSLVLVSGCIGNNQEGAEYLNEINDYISKMGEIGMEVNSNLQAQVDGNITEDELKTRLENSQKDVQAILSDLEASTPPAGYEEIKAKATEAIQEYNNFLTNYIEFLETGSGLETSINNLEAFTTKIEELRQLITEKA